MSRSEMHSSGIFYDSANLEGLEKWFHTGILGGATTNPLILQKDGVLNIPEHLTKMTEITGADFPISIEIPDSSWSVEKMVELGCQYQECFPYNAVIKVPMRPDDPTKAFEVLYKLGQEGVRTNATVGFTMGQLIGAAEAQRVSHANGDNYVSLFWARRDEAKRQIIEAKIKAFVEQNVDNRPTDQEIEVLKANLEKQIPDAAATLRLTLNYLNSHGSGSRIIVGSIRDIGQIEQAFNNGADIVTIPPKLLMEWMYTERGMETIQDFDVAYQKIADKLTLI